MIASASLVLGLTLPTVAQDGVIVPEAFEPILFGDKDGYVSEEAFFPGADLDPSIPDAAAILGQPVGSRIARPEEVLAAFSLWSQLSDRMELHDYGVTHEGRRLVYAIITSPENHARLGSIQRSIDLLSDPRGLDPERAEELVSRTPAIAWMGYSIHGDETSGSDAALAVAHRLVAGQEAATLQVLEQTVVVLDPCMNPDGRARIASQVEQSAGRRATLDPAAMQRGRWPYGRGNHYLFDMNRDWMLGVCPETRGRWRVNLALRPQLFVDAHEMSGLDTFLMYPQSAPRNPHLPERLLHWQGILADAHGAAFDERGWGYYTREWADGWGPYYSDAWGSLTGAIGMLYEQGRQAGQPLERESGEIVPYREAVHGQAVGSWSNLETLVQNREAVLRDYLAFHRSHVDGSRPGAERVFWFPRQGGERLLEVLLAQGIEVHPARAEDEVLMAVDALGKDVERTTVGELFGGAGYAVPVTQPRGAAVRAFLEFDPRIDAETVQDERARLERGEGTRMYDVTAWDLGRQLVHGAASVWGTPGAPLAEAVSAAEAPTRPAVEAGARPAYAWAVSVEDPAFHSFVVRAFDGGGQVHLSDEPFEVRTEAGYVGLPRGSVILRAHENAEGLDDLVAEAARLSGARPVRVAGGRAPDLEKPDLGGGHFQLLHQPRVALVSGDGVSTADFGHVWQSLDEALGLPVTLLDGASLRRTDLRPYNVLVLPPGSAGRWLSEDVQDWVRDGGTLIALGSSAAAVAAEGEAWTDTRRRRDVLEELETYRVAALRDRAASQASADWLTDAVLYDGERAPAVELPEAPTSVGLVDEDIERQDAWMRRFSPAGVILRVEGDPESWLTVGCPGAFAVPYSGSTALLQTGRVPLRLAPYEEVRLGGLLWPEARERVADSAWVTASSRGRGQVILFASSPVYRGGWATAARVLWNAVLFAPGAGADPGHRHH